MYYIKELDEYDFLSCLLSEQLDMKLLKLKINKPVILHL